MLFAEAGVVGLETVQAWDDDGFVVLPAFLSAAQVAPAVAGLGLLFPTAEEFHGGADDAERRASLTSSAVLTNFRSRASS